MEQRVRLGRQHAIHHFLPPPLPTCRARHRLRCRRGGRWGLSLFGIFCLVPHSGLRHTAAGAGPRSWWTTSRNLHHVGMHGRAPGAEMVRRLALHALDTPVPWVSTDGIVTRRKGVYTSAHTALDFAHAENTPAR